MNKEDEKILIAIKRREPIEEPFLKLSKILDIGKTGNYLSLCSDRIADAELIDGESVRIDFLNFHDLLLTAEGVRVCREILEGYVSDDILKDAYEALCEEAAVRESVNYIARLLREMKWSELFHTYKNSEERIRNLVVAEIRERLILFGCREKIHSLFYNVFVRVKYHRLISVCGKIAEDMVAKNDF